MLVIENLLTADELTVMHQRLLAAEWEAGGQTTVGHALSRKNNLQLRDGAEPASGLGALIIQRLWANPLFISAALPRKIYPPRFNRYGVGQSYGAHVDASLMRAPGSPDMLRTDLSATLFLSDPGEYDGGELEIEGSYGAQQVKLAAGDMVLYQATTLHRVAPVTRGERLASFFWIESLVGDDGQRALLFELDQTVQRLTAQLGADNAELVGLQGIYHNLMRRWVNT
jgi:PKHD-type hydroxylase